MATANDKGKIPEQEILKKYSVFSKQPLGQNLTQFDNFKILQ